MIYYLIAIIIISFSLIEIIQRKKNIFILWIFFCIYVLLILISGTRNNVGIDYKSYENIFYNIKNGFVNLSNIGFEYGYYFINKIVPSFWLLLLIIAIFSCSLKLKFIKDNSEVIFISIFLYFTGYFLRFDMGILRQSIALAILMYSIKFIEKKNLSVFITVILISTLFHSTAIIFLIVYPLANKNYSLKKIYIILAISMILSFTSIGNLVYELIGIFNDSIIGEKLVVYSQDIKFSYHLIDINMLKRGIFLIIFANVIKNKYSNNKKYNIYLNIYLIGVCIYYIFKSVAIISDRGSTYFNFIEILLFPIILKAYKNFIIKFLIIALIIVYGFFNLSTTINSSKIESINNRPYVPYNSWILE